MSNTAALLDHLAGAGGGGVTIRILAPSLAFPMRYRITLHAGADTVSAWAHTFDIAARVALAAFGVPGYDLPVAPYRLLKQVDLRWRELMGES